jgi:hypothetical protein
LSGFPPGPLQFGFSIHPARATASYAGADLIVEAFSDLHLSEQFDDAQVATYALIHTDEQSVADEAGRRWDASATGKKLSCVNWVKEKLRH